MNAINWSDWRIPDGKALDLSRLPTLPKASSETDKLQWPARMAVLAEELNRLQAMLYASKTRGLLLVLQGMDTSGKDGCIRTVFAHISPLGVRAEAFGVPQALEQRHDFLWRIHAKTPALGEMVIFNRSHYEDVLVPVVNGWITPEQTRQRLAHINDFERMLAETGTVILKCMLHISKDEQRQRLQDRIDDPDKHWKFSRGDLDDRKQWDDYQRAYEVLLNETSTPWAPWTVVPADSKIHRNLMIATLVRDTLKALNLRYPPEDLTLTGLRVP